MLTDRYPEGLAIEWLSVDVDGCKRVNIYKPLISRLIPTPILKFPHPVSTLVILTASTLTGIMILLVGIEDAWLIGQPYPCLYAGDFKLGS